MQWSKVADFAQRGITLALFSLTAYALLILGDGAYGSIQRRRRQRLTEAELDQSLSAAPTVEPSAEHVDDVRCVSGCISVHTVSYCTASSNT